MGYKHAQNKLKIPILQIHHLAMMVIQQKYLQPQKQTQNMLDISKPSLKFVF